MGPQSCKLGRSVWPDKAARVELDKGCEGSEAAVVQESQERRRLDQASAISLNDLSVLGRRYKGHSYVFNEYRIQFTVCSQGRGT